MIDEKKHSVEAHVTLVNTKSKDESKEGIPPLEQAKLDLEEKKRESQYRVDIASKLVVTIVIGLTGYFVQLAATNIEKNIREAEIKSAQSMHESTLNKEFAALAIDILLSDTGAQDAKYKTARDWALATLFKLGPVKKNELGMSSALILRDFNIPTDVKLERRLRMPMNVDIKTKIKSQQ
ncbi:MAG: hypothetical protein AB2722_10875 [Candidatus Thiodiazotropha sp.]